MYLYVRFAAKRCNAYYYTIVKIFQSSYFVVVTPTLAKRMIFLFVIVGGWLENSKMMPLHILFIYNFLQFPKY